MCDTRLTSAGGESWWLRVAVDNNPGIHVIWGDDRDGNPEMYYKKGAIASGVDEDPGINAIEYALGQNNPNFLNPIRTIAFSIPRYGKVELSIHNVIGRKIKTIVNEDLHRGLYEFVWNGKDEGGKPVSSGVYFYRMKTDDFSRIKKAILLK